MVKKIDFVILSQTLQAFYNPEKVLKDLKGVTSSELATDWSANSDATEEEIRTAAKLSFAEEFIKGEVLIKNEAIGLNYIDTYHRSGLYPLKLPSGIGLEAAGKVEEVGSDVSEFNIGDNIAYATMPIGAYSQQRIIPAKIAVKIPDGISQCF